MFGAPVNDSWGQGPADCRTLRRWADHFFERHTYTKDRYIVKCQGGRIPSQLFTSVVQLSAEVCSVISGRRQLAEYFARRETHTKWKMCLSPPRTPSNPSTLLSTSHTGQKKAPGEHRNKEEADRGREAEAPVHKGARLALIARTCGGKPSVRAGLCGCNCCWRFPDSDWKRDG